MTSKSAITPSLSGRIALIDPGVRPEHPLRLETDRVHLPGRLVDRDHRRLAQNDPAAPDIDERVGRAEIDRHVPTAKVEDAHQRSVRPLYAPRSTSPPKPKTAPQS